MNGQMPAAKYTVPSATTGAPRVGQSVASARRVAVLKPNTARRDKPISRRLLRILFLLSYLPGGLSRERKGSVPAAWRGGIGLSSRVGCEARCPKYTAAGQHGQL